MNQADYPVKFDSRLRFRIYLIPGEVLKLIDELPTSVAKSANIKLFEEGASGTLGVNIDNMRKSWENIQKIEIRVGTERYRPYMHDVFLANPVSHVNKAENLIIIKFRLYQNFSKRKKFSKKQPWKGFLMIS